MTQTKTKKNLYLISMATMLVIMLSLFLFLSRSIEFGYMLSRITPAFITNHVCNPNQQTKEQLSTTLKNLHANLGPMSSYSEWLRTEVEICNKRIYVYDIEGGYYSLSMYDPQGDLVDSCEQWHTVLGVYKGSQCSSPQGSLRWQADK